MDNDCDVRAKFFDYIIATRIPSEKNSEEPRTASAIYLMSTLNAKGSVYAYDLVTELNERVFTCDRFRIKYMPEIAVAKIIELWERDEPRTRRKRKAAWKMARAGREYDRPVLPPEEADGDIADVAQVPQNRGPQEGPDFPVEDLAPAARVNTAPVRGAEAEPDQPEREHTQEAPYRGEEPGDDPVELIDYDDDFRTKIDSSEDLIPQEDDAALNIEADPGPPPQGVGLRRSARLAGRRVDTYVLWAYRTSLSLALKKRSKGTHEAIQKELSQMIKKRVWTYMRPTDLTPDQRKKVIRSHMFLKDKYRADWNV